MTEQQSVSVRIATPGQLQELVRRLRLQTEDHKRLSGTLRRQAQRDNETIAFLTRFAAENGIELPTEPTEAES